METSFTPVSALAGGALIGLAAALLLLGNGRVAGISGILGGALIRPREDGGWRLAFLAGLLLGALVVTLAYPPAARVALETPLPLLAAAGVLVGFGTRMGNGCTSGHGVCGVARGSRRSIAATLVFFTVALATVFVTRHGLLAG